MTLKKIEKLDFNTNPDEGVEMLKICLFEGKYDLFLVALRKATIAWKGISSVAKETGFRRESLYKTLSLNGNPKWETVEAVVNSLGFQFELKPIPSPRKKSIRKRTNVKSR